MKSMQRLFKKMDISNMQNCKIDNKQTILFILALFILSILFIVLFLLYKIYFKLMISEGFSQSFIYNISNSCRNLSDDLNVQLKDPSNTDLSNNTYYINRLLKASVINESVVDLSNNLNNFISHCKNNDCSGIPQENINDISLNITNIGNILTKLTNPSEAILTDFSNIQQFYTLSFDCSGGFCQ